jgi:polysaccharide biosynthesis transport protein
MDSEQTTLSFEQVLGILRLRALWILLCVVLAAAAAYGLSKSQTKKYTATASIAFSNNSLSEEIAGLSESGGGSATAQEASNLELVKLGDMAAKTARRLGHGLTEEQVAASLQISGQGESSVVDVAAKATSPALAAAIANTYAGQFVEEQQNTTRRYFKAALALVNRQLARLSPAQRVGADGLDLQNRAQSLALIAELGYNKVQIAAEAGVPSSPSSPRTKRNTLLGAVLGLLLGIVVTLLLERFDRRIRGPEDLEAVYRLPMLGGVPKSGRLARSRRNRGKSKPLPPTEAEAFGLIRAHLRFFNVDRVLRTLVIASASPGDGKTTIARHLASAAARAGARVLLLEADLRHPTLARQLNIQSGEGLAGVLIGSISMEAATSSVPLPVSPGEGISGRKLDVLVAGSVLPPNPGELLESSAMDVLLAQAKSIYDLVVIDTPPLTAVSDAFPLLTRVDGVVVVGWVGRSRRDAAEQLQQILMGSEIPLLGVIANGAKSAGPGSYAEPESGKSAPLGAAAGAASSPEELAPSANS